MSDLFPLGAPSLLNISQGWDNSMEAAVCTACASEADDKEVRIEGVMTLSHGLTSEPVSAYIAKETPEALAE